MIARRVVGVEANRESFSTYRVMSPCRSVKGVRGRSSRRAAARSAEQPGTHGQPLGSVYRLSFLFWEPAKPTRDEQYMIHQMFRHKALKG